jgi:hypothetical protein
VLSVDVSSEDSSKVGHGLDEIVDRGVVFRFALDSGSVGSGLVAATTVEDKQRSFVGVLELVAFVGKHIGLLNRETLQNAIADRLREASEIGRVALSLGETLLFHEIVGEGDEASIVLS